MEPWGIITKINPYFSACKLSNESNYNIVTKNYIAKKLGKASGTYIYDYIQ